MLNKYIFFILFLFTSPLCVNQGIRIPLSVFLPLDLCDEYNLTSVWLPILVSYIQSSSHCLGMNTDLSLERPFVPTYNWVRLALHSLL